MADAVDHDVNEKLPAADGYLASIANGEIDHFISMRISGLRDKTPQIAVALFCQRKQSLRICHGIVVVSMDGFAQQPLGMSQLHYKNVMDQFRYSLRAGHIAKKFQRLGMRFKPCLPFCRSGLAVGEQLFESYTRITHK